MAMENTDKKRSDIAVFYDGLGRAERGRFMLWVQTRTYLSQRTVQNRIADDAWSPLAREAIMKAIRDGSWRQV